MSGALCIFPSTVALDTVKADRVNYSKLLSVLAELSHSRILIHMASLTLTAKEFLEGILTDSLA